jgi:hypothetical protein
LKLFHIFSSMIVKLLLFLTLFIYTGESNYIDQPFLSIFGVRKPQGNVTAPVNNTHQPAKREKNIPNQMIVTFVNGIYHSENDVKEISEYLKATFRCDVRSFYNPTSGSWVKDAYKAGFEMVLRPNDLALAKKLAEHLRSALNDVNPKQGRVLHIAHSGGAILTYLAAKYHLTHSEVTRIDVITLGGGRSLTRKYFRGRLFNYYARNDPVLIVEQRAAKLLKRTRNDTYEEIRDIKHNTSFVFLTGIAKDPIFDHSMNGPTYRKALAYEAEQFQHRLNLLLLFEAKERDLLRKIRKQAANITGVHNFWMSYSQYNVAHMGRRLRKYSARTTNIHGLFSGKSREVTHRGAMVSEANLLLPPAAVSFGNSIVNSSFDSTIYNSCVADTSNTSQIGVNTSHARGNETVAAVASVNASAATIKSLLRLNASHEHENMHRYSTAHNSAAAVVRVVEVVVFEQQDQPRPLTVDELLSWGS